MVTCPRGGHACRDGPNALNLTIISAVEIKKFKPLRIRQTDLIEKVKLKLEFVFSEETKLLVSLTFLVKDCISGFFCCFGYFFGLGFFFGSFFVVFVVVAVVLAVWVFVCLFV